MPRISPPVPIRVAVIDDHDAVRIGLRVALLAESGLEPVGSAASGAACTALLNATHPAVLVLDYHLPDVDGLTLCRRMKSAPGAPGVVLFSAFADASLTVPALVAGVDAIVDKAAPTQDLFDAIRRAARGQTTLPEIAPPLLEAAGQVLDPRDLPILGMLVRQTPVADIASTLRIAPQDLERRISAMLASLRTPVAAS